MTFLEIIGNASTSVRFNGCYIGHNVNAAAYEDGDSVVIRLESNGSWVKQASQKIISRAQYDDFCEKRSRPLFVRGIELMGAEVMLGERDE